MLSKFYFCDMIFLRLSYEYTSYLSISTALSAKFTNKDLRWFMNGSIYFCIFSFNTLYSTSYLPALDKAFSN